MVARRRLRILIFDSIGQKLQMYIDTILAQSLSYSRERIVCNSAGCVTASRGCKRREQKNEIIVVCERKRERA